MNNPDHGSAPDSGSNKRPVREYPPFFERVVPIALGLLALAVLVVLLIIFGVALGLVPGS